MAKAKKIVLLPSTRNEWQDALDGQEYKDSIHTYPTAQSGSKMEFNQYLLLRVLRRKRKPMNALWLPIEDDKKKDKESEESPPPSNQNGWILTEFLRRAQTILQTYPSWATYLNSITRLREKRIRPDNTTPDLGTFSFAYYNHRSVCRVPAEDSGYTVKLEYEPISSRLRSVRATLPVLPITPNRPSQLEPAQPPPVLKPRLAKRLEELKLGKEPAPQAPGPVTPKRAPQLEPAQPPSVRKTRLAKRLEQLGFELGKKPEPQALSPSSSDSKAYKRAVGDEETVNIAFLALVSGFSMHSPVIQADWRASRQGFQLAPHDRNGIPGEKVYEARVDGVLRNRLHPEKLVAIAEVKPFLRDAHPVEIGMQEAAQLAAWICADPPEDLEDMRQGGSKSTRLLISQDRHEIYLSFAEFDASYVDYVRNKATTHSPFLIVNEHGPFNIEDMTHVRAFAVNVIGWTLQETETPQD